MGEIINVQNENGILAVSSRQVAENFEKRHSDIIEAIETLIKGCAEKSADLFIESKYQHEQNKQWYKEYLITRDGFSLLVMGFTGAKALEWKLKYIAAFNEMEKHIQNNAPQLDNLSPQLQLLINLETSQKQQAKALEDTNKRIDNIGEVIALDTTSWRSDAHKLITKIATNFGSFDHIKDINTEINQLVDKRGGVCLATRLTNKQQRMALEGVCKSKRDKLTKVDIIADDKKLIEIYVAIVKEMAVRYGVTA